jgi:predicted SAM-dependent methyltransferase
MNLNLGCGFDYIEGWVNLDKSKACKVDINHDIEVFPYPIETNSIDKVLASHVIEHVNPENFIEVFRELHRICKPNGLIEIYCPYYLSKNAFADFTHRMFITEDTFDFFCRGAKHRKNGVLYGINFEFEKEYAGTYIEDPDGKGNTDIYIRLKVLK